MSNAEEKVFPSKWFLFSFLGLSGLAMIMSLTVWNGWLMWMFPAYVFLWSRGIQNHDRGLRKEG